MILFKKHFTWTSMVLLLTTFISCNAVPDFVPEVSLITSAGSLTDSCSYGTTVHFADALTSLRGTGWRTGVVIFVLLVAF